MAGMRFSINKRVLEAATVLGVAVYVYDCYQFWKVYTEEINYVENVKPTKEELDDLEKKYISLENSSCKISDSKTFKSELEHVKQLKDYEKRLRIENMREFDKISRESVVFLAGGRAAFLQNAHPYVASGVTQHSDLKNSVHRRFILTFKHVFAITFGNKERALKSALEVRRLHDNVVGELPEDVGVFKKGHKYAANNMHALYWVNQTLVEGAVFAFELFVRKLTDIEKDNHYKSVFPRAAAFGIPLDEFPKSFKEFKREAAVFMNSPILTVGKDSRDIQRFLLSARTMSGGKKPRPLLVLAANQAKWLTFMMLPRRITKQYFGRTPTQMEVLKFALIGGFIRFYYRLLPRSIRYLNPYLDMVERQGLTKMGTFGNLMKRLSGKYVNKAIYSALPSAKDLREKEI